MTKVIVDLEKPCGGWSFLSLEDDNGSSNVVLSYIDGNIAIKMLKKFYKYLKNCEPCILFEFDGESHGTQVVSVQDRILAKGIRGEQELPTGKIFGF